MIRPFVGAFVLGVLVGVTPVQAQTEPGAACGPFAPGPRIPDGARASNSAMTSARSALEAWRTTRRAEVEACRAAIERVQAQLNAMQTAHNQAVTETDALIAQFAEENAEYAGRRRGRGSNRPN